MRMICEMCGHMRLDKTMNEAIRDKVRVTRIEYTMREARPRWFGHVWSSIDAP